MKPVNIAEFGIPTVNAGNPKFVVNSIDLVYVNDTDFGVHTTTMEIAIDKRNDLEFSYNGEYFTKEEIGEALMEMFPERLL